MTFPKRPSHPVHSSTRPPPSQGGSSQRPPISVKDALTEARAISGGGLTKSAIPSANATKKTIMLVDEDAAMRMRLRIALEPFYEVLEAKDGMEAAELAAKIQPPAMIVSDVAMPRVDGFTLAKIIRSNPVMKRVPIMFVSARNSPQDVTQALVVGACQYVLKSVPIGEIVAKIRKIAP